MEAKTRTYIFIGLGVLALILLIAAVVSFMSGADTTTAGGMGAAAGLVTLMAAKLRNTARTQIDKAEEEITEVTGDIHENVDAAREEMTNNEAEIAEMTPDEKVALGNDLLNPDKPDRSA